jgi:mannose-6-phosphate isomerase-like protein (cupin superfamily)
MDKVNLADKFALFHDTWSPKIAGELNGQHILLAKLQGDFVWQKHDAQDEMFLVISGRVAVYLRDRVVALEEGEFFVVPRGVEHKPVAKNLAEVLLFEPQGTAHAGDVRTEMTVNELERI